MQLHKIAIKKSGGIALQKPKNLIPLKKTRNARREIFQE